MRPRHTTPTRTHDIIEQEIEAYREGMPPPDPVWPVDLRALMVDLQDHLFDPGLRIKEAEERCGLGDHNISTRFAYFVGDCPKAYVTGHRITLAKHLLRHEELQRVKLIRIALAVGYGSQSAFTMAFKKHEGCTPGVYRKRQGRGN